MSFHIRQMTRCVVLILTCAIALPAVAQEEDDFVPPQGALPAKRTGGASRNASFKEGSATVSLIAPGQVLGLTTRDKPVIHWSLSADTDQPIEVGINGPDKETLFETTLKGPHKAGLHKLDLSKLKQDGKPVALKAGQKYDVVVTIAAQKSGASANPTATC